MSGGDGSEAGEEGHGADPSGGGLFMFICLAIGVLTRVIVSPKTGLPYTVLLLVVGAALGSADYFSEQNLGAFGESMHIWVDIDPHVFLLVFLPALIFGSAFSVDYHTFSREIPQMLVLAVIGVVLASLLSAMIAVFVFPYGWDWNAGLAFGAMMSATDPVAVVALLRELGASKRLSLLIEGESLFNDGTAMVIFIVFSSAMAGEQLSAEGIAVSFVRLAIGGSILGILMGFVALYLLLNIHFDIVAEITVTLFMCYGTFLIAESTPLHVSGILAVVTLGLVMSASARTSATDHHSMHHFWEMLEYLANTVVFLLSGVIIVEKGFVSGTITTRDWGLLLLLYVLLHMIRGFVVYLLLPVLRRLGYGLSGKEATVLVYSGLRGAVGLVLALILDRNEAIPASTRALFTFHMAGIATLTLLVNGTTTKYVVTHFGLTKPSEASQIMFRNAVNHITLKTRDTVARLQRDEFYSDADWEQVDAFLPDLCDRVDHIIDKIERDQHFPEAATNLIRKATMGLLSTTVRKRRRSVDKKVPSLSSIDEHSTPSHNNNVDGQYKGYGAGALTLMSFRGLDSVASPRSVASATSPRGSIGSPRGSLASPRSTTRQPRSGKAAPSPAKKPGSRVAPLPAKQDSSVSNNSSAANRYAGDADDDELNHSDAGMKARAAITSALFAIKRVATLADATEAFVAEARHRFLNLVKSAYWKEFDEGMVSRSAITQLLTAASESQDQPHLPLHEWNYMKEELKQSQLVVGCTNLKGLRGTGLARRLVFRPLAYEYDAVTTFVSAHASVESVFKALVENDRVSRKVLAESRKQIAAARAVLDDIVEHFPEVTRAIKTQHVVHALLHETQKVASDLLHHGEIEEKEFGQITSIVGRAFRESKVPIALGLPSTRELVRDAGILLGLPAEQANALLEIAQERFHPKGSRLVTQGEKTSGFYIIVRGNVALKRLSGMDGGVLELGEDSGVLDSVGSIDVESKGALSSESAGSRKAWSGANLKTPMGSKTVVARLHRGAVVGLLSHLTGNPQLTTATCESPVDAFYFDEARVFKLLRSHSEVDGPYRTVSPLERNLCRSAGVIMARMFLPRFKHFEIAKLRQIIEESTLVRPVPHQGMKLGSHAILLSGGMLARQSMARERADVPVVTAESAAGVADVSEITLSSQSSDRDSTYDPQYAVKHWNTRVGDMVAAGEFVVEANAFTYIELNESVVRYFGDGVRLLLLPEKYVDKLEDTDNTLDTTVKLHKKFSAIFRMGSAFMPASLNTQQATDAALEAWQPSLGGLGEIEEGDEEDDEEDETIQIGASLRGLD